MSTNTPTLEEFIRHAERYVTELVYETAAEGYLEPDELGLLSLALQRIDRHWRLTPDQKSKLALALCERKLPLKRICEMSQLHRATVYRLREQAAQPAEQAACSAQPCGADVANDAPAATATSEPELQHGNR